MGIFYSSVSNLLLFLLLIQQLFPWCVSNLSSDPWQQFSVTLPQQQARGYTSEQVRTDLNQLVEDYLYQNHGIFNKTPFNNMIASITINSSSTANTVAVLLTYTDATKCKIRGDHEYACWPRQGTARHRLPRLLGLYCPALEATILLR